MKKIIQILTVMIMALTIANNSVEVGAYEFTEDSYYIFMDVQTLGEIKVYIPINQIELLQITKDRSTVVNVSNGSCYGYFNWNNTEYRVTFNSFSTPTYRETEGSYGTSNQDLIINEILETNIRHLKNEEEKNVIDYIIQNRDMVVITTFIIIMGLVVLIWLKH